MKKTMHRKGSQGFSLIEIIVVITIIGLIVGWAATQIFGKGDMAQARIAKSKIVGMSGPLDLYKLDTGKFPNTSDGLKALITAPSGVTNWNGPYVRNADELKDPWKNDLIYRSPGADNRPWEIVSLGSDGQEGGEGAARDIKSWE
ncbi:MAG: type II secretion system major pseudopilin GspG [Betaproteobacteria bacterium]